MSTASMQEWKIRITFTNGSDLGSDYYRSFSIAAIVFGLQK